MLPSTEVSFLSSEGNSIDSIEITNKVNHMLMVKVQKYLRKLNLKFIIFFLFILLGYQGNNRDACPSLPFHINRNEP